MNAPATRVSVPAKAILVGEHAAVYGCPALVAGLGMRLTVRLTPSSAAGVHIKLPSFGVDQRSSWQEILTITDDLRSLWQAYSEDPTPARFRALRSQDPGRLVKLALGEAARAVQDDPTAAGHPCRGLSVDIESSVPPGSGFGSSAAAAVGLVAAYAATCGLSLNWDWLEAPVLEVERRQHGSPSGVDAATVFHGGVLWAHRPDGVLELEPVAARPDLLRHVDLYDTGRPAESTGAVVAEVRGLRDRDPADFATRLASLRQVAGELRSVLTDHDSKPESLLMPLRTSQRHLEHLGVVPLRVRRIVEQVEAAGGAAKISGAGSLTGPGAGSLLVVAATPAEVPALRDLRRIVAPLGAEGVRVESLA